MAGVGDGALAVVTAGREELCDAEITLGGGREKIVLCILWRWDEWTIE